MNRDPNVCPWCDEPVTEADQQNDLCGQLTHAECLFRSIMGSVAHIERRCSCYVDDAPEHDPPGMSRREAAKAAVVAYEKREGRKVSL
ncbi:MAG TPA: hypothetical protein VFL19_03140 [Nitrospira sp.]|nr:hypothetical protein [Nitrospira sp.]